MSPRDVSVIMGLVQYAPTSERWRELMNDLKGPEALQVAEAFFDQRKYDDAPEDVRATVDYLRKWLENTQQRRREREVRRRSALP